MYKMTEADKEGALGKMLRERASNLEEHVLITNQIKRLSKNFRALADNLETNPENLMDVDAAIIDLQALPEKQQRAANLRLLVIEANEALTGLGFPFSGI